MKHYFILRSTDMLIILGAVLIVLTTFPLFQEMSKDGDVTTSNLILHVIGLILMLGTKFYEKHIREYLSKKLLGVSFTEAFKEPLNK